MHSATCYAYSVETYRLTAGYLTFNPRPGLGTVRLAVRVPKSCQLPLEGRFVFVGDRLLGPSRENLDAVEQIVLGVGVVGAACTVVVHRADRLVEGGWAQVLVTLGCPPRPDRCRRQGEKLPKPPR